MVLNLATPAAAENSPVLAAKPEIVVATKMDLTGAHERANGLEKALQSKGIPLRRICAVTGEGLARFWSAWNCWRRRCWLR